MRKNKKKKIGMKWYNFLVHFWLPLSALITLGAVGLCGVGTYSNLTYELKQDQFDVSSVLIFAYLTLVGLIMFVYTVGLRKSLKGYEGKSSKLLVIWYLLPVLFSMGLMLFTSPMLSKIGDGKMTIYIFLGVIIATFARAFVMIPLNIPYFLKREDKFDEFVDVAGREIAAYFDM